MNPPRPRFEVEDFERVQATPGIVLLRLRGTWTAPEAARLPPPVLSLDDGRRTHRLGPLPGPDDAAPLATPEGSPWRTAFRVPADLLGPRTAYALDAGGGLLVDLPVPHRRAGAVPDGAVRARTTAAPVHDGPAVQGLRRAVEEERARRGQAERSAEDLRVALAAVEVRLQSALEAARAQDREQREALAAVTEEVRVLRSTLAVLTRERDEALAGPRPARVPADRVVALVALAVSVGAGLLLLAGLLGIVLQR